MKKFLIILIILFVGGIMLISVLSRIPVGERIAVLTIDGVIINPLPIIKKIDRLSEDKSVKALVLRVDSPGGSVGASQEIYRAIERFKEKGKPVVVSMGNIAASGGYYISAPADFIYANPGTITGSIGVIIQYIGYKELLSKIGIKAEAIKTGKFKDTLSPFKDLTKEEKDYLKRVITDSYEQFINAILKYRKDKITEEELRKIADGRVMTGLKAKEIGLVDEIGNLKDAIDKAAELAGVLKPRVFYVEEKKSFLKKILGGDIEDLRLLNSYNLTYYLMDW